MVLSGSLRLFRTSDDGRELTGYHVTPGNICILASVCVMGELKYDFSAQADEDTLTAMMPPKSFKELMDKSIEFKNYIFTELADRLVSSISLIEDIKFTSIENRIRTYLKDNADMDGILRITHENLAINIGSVREVVSRKLKQMEKNGYLSLSRGVIRLSAM
jgi:CRP/FNR family transcriptional regulator